MKRKTRTKDAATDAPAVAAAEAPRRSKAPGAAPAPPADAAPKERQPDFIWGGQPVFECHLGCGDRFQRIGDLAAVVDHEKTAHPTNLRVSEQLLGEDGRPLIVRTD